MRITHAPSFVVAAVLTAWSWTARADQPAGVLYERGGLSGTGLAAGLKLGAGFSQPFGALGTSFVGELEVGVLLPPLRRSLEVFLSGQYAAPAADGETSVPDPRLPGDGTMHWELTQRQLILTLGGIFRLPIATKIVRPYVGLGARLYLMRTEVDGDSAGEPFGENDETSTEVGFWAALGGELYAGPGAVLLELQLGYAPTDGFVLRDTSVGATNVSVGYRLFL